MALKPKNKIKFLRSVDGEAGALSIKYADIFTIEYLPDNIKAHDKEAIKQSIRDHGFVEPIGINRRTGHDIFGNGRLECLREMFDANETAPRGIVEKSSTAIAIRSQNSGGPKQQAGRAWFAPIVDGIDMDAGEEVALAIRMWKTAESGSIDASRAIEVLKRLQSEDPKRFAQTGYSAEEMERIRHIAKFNQQVEDLRNPDGSNSEVQKDAETAEELLKRLQKKWKVTFGDHWQIGKHVLYCADNGLVGPNSLFGDPMKTARLTFTSPPYDSQRSYEVGKFNWTDMMKRATDSIFAVSADPADIIVNLGPVMEDRKVKFYWNEWLDYCESIGHACYGQYVWDKLRGAVGETHGRLARAHEFFFHFKIGTAPANKWIPTTGEVIRRGPREWSTRKEDGSLKQGLDSLDTLGQDFKVPDSVIRLSPELARGLPTSGHPAVFPVTLPEFFINTYTKAGDYVFEPFAGSGTTMVACQNTDRVCFATEISPNYCALILERMSTTFPDLEVKKL